MSVKNKYSESIDGGDSFTDYWYLLRLGFLFIR